MRSFNPVKGWGFVECDQTKLIYSQDVFLLKQELPAGFSVSAGDHLTFKVKQGQKGIQATEVKVVTPPEKATFVGELKSWNDDKGYGFISCEASHQLHGKDVFVLRTELQQPVVMQGTRMQFKVRVGERGPVAYEVQVLGAAPGGGSWEAPSTAWQGQKPQQQQSWMPGPIIGSCKGPWGMQAAWGGQAPAAQWGAAGGGQAWGAAGGVKAPNESEVFFGTIKAVNAEKGWGHIICEATHKLYGKDMFVMKTGLESVSPSPGLLVAFNVAQSPKGPHATNLRALTGIPDQMYAGSIKSFNAEKGWGFIEAEVCKLIYVTDVFVHKTDLAEGWTPNAGDQVQFTIDLSGGRAAAKTVQPGAGAMQPSGFEAIKGPPMIVPRRVTPY